MNAASITAVAGAIVAVLGAVTALIIAFRPMLTEILTEVRRSRIELGKNTAVTLDTHTMINSQREAAEDQQTRTDNVLREHGIPIPENPAVRTQVTGTEVHIVTEHRHDPE